MSSGNSIVDSFDSHERMLDAMETRNYPHKVYLGKEYIGKGWNYNQAKEVAISDMNIRVFEGESVKFADYYIEPQP